MKANSGVGLAASQVGFNNRIVVIDCTELPGGNPHQLDEEDEILVLINPELELSGNRIRWREACLSVPGVDGMVERRENVNLKFVDTAGNPQQLDLTWPISGVVQHECDHLDGVLYPQRMSQLTRKMLFKKLGRFKKKLEKNLISRMGLQTNDKNSSRPKNMKAKKTRRQNSKAARVSRRASRSR
jgi:peptide deformylase